MEVDKEKLRNKIFEESTFGPLVDKTFDASDWNRSGFIEKSELAILLKGINATLNIPPPTEEDIQKEFTRLDLNCDGLISKQEFRALIKDIVLFSIEHSAIL